MLVVKASDVKAEVTSGPMLGQGTCFRQLLVNEDMANGVIVAIASFNPGARLSMHTHTSEQVIYCLDGAGIIATEKEKCLMTPGTLVIVPAGELHWHGATDNTPFTHLAVFRGEGKAK